MKPMITTLFDNDILHTMCGRTYIQRMSVTGTYTGPGGRCYLYRGRRLGRSHFIVDKPLNPDNTTAGDCLMIQALDLSWGLPHVCPPVVSKRTSQALTRLTRSPDRIDKAAEELRALLGKQALLGK